MGFHARAAAAAAALFTAAVLARPPHRFDERVAAIVANMTLEQKAESLDMWMGSQDLLTNGTIDWKKVEGAFGLGVGPVIHDLYDPTGDIQRQLQSYILNQPGSPGVPAVFVEECLHGVQQAGKTVFPQQIALAATFNPPIAQRIGAMIAQEARAYGIMQCFAPVIGTAREPRWGRVEETYGEDVYLTSELALNWVLGAQGGPDGLGLNANTSIIAEPKHYIAHSQPESGTNAAPVHIGRRELLTTFAPQFEKAVKLGGARGIMAAYHEMDGVPSCANNYTLTQLLREEWGFQGWVLADDGAVHMMFDTHQTAADPADALSQFLTAGGNVPYYDFPHDLTHAAIVASVNNGTLSEAVVDARVADLIRVKLELGLFEDPFPHPELIQTNVDTQAARDLALEVARQSIVLLQNKPLPARAAAGVAPDASGPAPSTDVPYSGGLEAGKPLLPLDLSRLKRIAVLGPSADVMRFGDYTGGGVHERFVTPLQGIQAAVAASGKSVTVSYALGVQTNSPSDILARQPMGLEWAPVPQGRFLTSATNGSPGLNGSYWAGGSVDGSPGFTRLDPDVSFQWYVYGPGAYSRSPVTAGAPFLNASFCAVWAGAIVPPVSAPGVSMTVFADGPDTTFKLTLNGAVAQTHGQPPAVLDVTEGVPLPFSLEYCRDPAGQNLVLLWNLLPNGAATGNEDAAVAAALATAAGSDVAVLVVGESDGLNGLNKATVGEGIDVNTLDLTGRQQELALALVAQGTPVVVVLVHGRPLSIPALASSVPAIVSMWFGGQAQGTALADVLFGAFSPAGRTPVTWPHDVGQLPCYYNFKPSARRHYVFEQSDPVWSFGHGISYTEFAYARLAVTPPTVSLASGANVTVTVEVTNTGPVASEEVVQLYVRDDVSSVTTPVRTLKGVVRITPALPSGKAQTVVFMLSPAEDLWLINRDYDRVTEPGTFTLWAAASSTDLRLNSTLTVTL